MTKTVLITGGAGFIGSNLARGLLKKGFTIKIIDNLATSKIENIDDIKDDVDFVKASILDFDALKNAMKSCDYVLHQAAIPSVQRSIKEPFPSNDVNIKGTLNVLQAAKECDIKRVVHASSSSVYGDSEVLPKVETMSTNPKSLYASQKLTAELYCKIFYEIFGLETVALRYFNVFGPYQSPKSEYAAVIPKFISNLLNNRKLIIYGDGKQSRDFSFIANVVQANLLALKAKKAPGEVINIACGERRDLNDMVSMLGEIVGKQPKVEYSEPRAGDIKHSLADISKAKEILGYKPEVSFEEGLKITIDWMKNAR